MAPSPPQLMMRLRSLDRLPSLARLPPEFRIRTLKRSEAPDLARLLQAAFPEIGWTPEKTVRALVESPDVEATYVIAQQGRLVATASARADPGRPPETGYLHWVGVSPEHRGRGFGRIISLRVLRHFRDSERTDCVLETDDFRLAAIKVYLKLGFVPEICDSTHGERWAAVFRAIQTETARAGVTH